MRAIALTLALLAVPTVASAQSAEQRIASIRELIFSARFDDAIEAAHRLLERGDLSAVERNAALEVLATAQVATRGGRDAERTLALLYARDPGHRLTDPDASPPVISAFARAREAEPDPIPVRIEHQPPRLTRREPPMIVVRITEGGDAVHEVRLVYRTGDEGTTRVLMTRRRDGTFGARIPVVGDATQPLDVAYHIVALAPSQTPLANHGSPAEPLQLRIPAEGGAAASSGEQPPIFQEQDPDVPGEEEGGGDDIAEAWWLWTLIGVLVVGGVTTGIIFGTMQSPTSGTLGTARLELLAW